MICWPIIQEFSCRKGHVHEGHDDGHISTYVPGRAAGRVLAQSLTFQPSLLGYLILVPLNMPTGTMSDSNIIQKNEEDIILGHGFGFQLLNVTAV